jgi:adenosylmethionine-8-amino-7-oxononanoate aminotransferase
MTPIFHRQIGHSSPPLAKREAIARGPIVRPIGGTVDGVAGDHLWPAPPFIVDESLINAIVQQLSDAIDAAGANIS